MTSPLPVVATTRIPGEHCELCGKGPGHGVVLIQMMPGPDGQPWALCVGDYNEGRAYFSSASAAGAGVKSTKSSKRSR